MYCYILTMINEDDTNFDFFVHLFQLFLNGMSASTFVCVRSLKKTLHDLYFLHHYDNSGLALVSQVLTSENYASWSHEVTVVLSIKNENIFIVKPITQCPTYDTIRLKSQLQNNNIVISRILDSISKVLCYIRKLHSRYGKN